MDPCIIKQIS